MRNIVNKSEMIQIDKKHMTKAEKLYMLLYNDKYREQECSRCCAPKWLKKYDAEVKKRRLEEQIEAERKRAAALEAWLANEQREENKRRECERIKIEQMEQEIEAAMKKKSRKRFMFDEYSDAEEQVYFQTTESSEHEYYSEEPCSSSERISLLPDYKKCRKTPNRYVRGMRTDTEKSSSHGSL